MLFSIINNNKALIARLQDAGVKLDINDKVQEEFKLACIRSDISVIRHFLNQGVVVDEDFPHTIRYDLTPDAMLVLLESINTFNATQFDKYYRYAIETQRPDILEVLDKVKPQDALKFGVWQTVINYESIKVIEHFLRNGKKGNINLLMFLMGTDRPDLVKLVLEQDPSLAYEFGGLKPALLYAIENKKNIEGILLVGRFKHDELTELLIHACRHGRADAVNSLLKYNAKFPSSYRTYLRTGPDYRALLYQAYKLDQNTREKLLDTELMQHASLLKHENIYNFLKEQNYYKNELEQDHQRLPAEVKESIIRGDFFKKYNVHDRLQQLCRDGKLELFKMLLEKENIQLSNYKHCDILLSIASDCNHPHIVHEIVSEIPKENICKYLNIFLQSRSYPAVAMLLEACRFHDIKNDVNLIAGLKNIHSELYNHYIKHMLYEKNEPRLDALERKEKVTNEKNALGVILHSTIAHTPSWGGKK